MKRSLHCICALCAAALLLGSLSNLKAQEYRAIDGSNNNFLKPSWGAAGANLVYAATIAYEDGFSTPSGADRPNPRAVSNAIFSQNTMANDPRGLSAFAWAWGQFIDHDVTLVPDNPNEPMNISVPPFDAFFDPYGSGQAVIPMLRSAYDPTTGTGPENPRQHFNAITAFIDASAVYGSDEERAFWLRTFSGGKLRVSAGNMPPFNTTTGEYGAPVDPTVPHMAMPLPYVTKWYVLGDERGNENPFLLAMHALFVREHNRLCDELGERHPGWTDEQLYQHARKLVGAIIQAIVYEEWLPTLGIKLDPYNGYNPYTDPGVMNIFSAAAFRYGHTTINPTLLRMDDNGHTIPQGNINLRDAFFNTQATIEAGGIEPLLIGMSTVVQQNFDCKVIDDLRNFLFGPPGAGGLDLVSINLNRGRDRGLADYNTIRADFGLAPRESFPEICSDPLMSASLQLVYHDVNHIDPWVGMLAEDHMPGALFGETAMEIIGRQFHVLREGDRFYYENDPWLTPEEKSWISGNRLADVIRRNCPVTCLHDDIFMAQSLTANRDFAISDQLPLILFPNPVTDQLNIRLGVPASGKALARITDAYGRELMRRELDELTPGEAITFALDANLPAGIYHVVVMAGNQLGHQAFVRVNGR